MAYLNLLGYYEKDKDIILHNLLNSSIQNSVYTKYHFLTLKNTYAYRYSNVDDGIMLQGYSNRFLLKDRHGEYTTPCKSLCFEEKYFEKGYLYKKTYILFID